MRVDLIVSNCVINLSPDKLRVLREACRVLKPGGRPAIADVLATQVLPEELRAMLAAAGFERTEIVLRESSRTLIAQWSEDPKAGEFVVSTLVTAFKPVP